MKKVLPFLLLSTVAFGQVLLKDEGVSKGPVNAIDCIGTGVTCARSGATGTVTISAGGGGGAPTSAEYMVKSADATLTAERVATDSTSITWDWSVAGIVKANVVTPVATASALASDPAACTSGQYVTDQNASGTLVCSQVAYSQLSGTPTLYDQTCQEEGTSVTQRAIMNFIGPAVTVADDAVNSKTKVTVVASGTGACGSNTWVSTLNDGSAPTCTQPGFSNISGSVAASQLPAPTSTTLGGVKGTGSALTCSGTNKVTGFDSAGALQCGADVDTGITQAYVTAQEEGTGVTQRSIMNFIGPAVTVADDGVNSKTKVTVVASGTGACGGSTWVSTLNDGAAPTCTQPAFSNLSGSASASQLPLATATTVGAVKGTGSALTCGGTNKATGFAADGTLQCGADVDTGITQAYVTAQEEATSVTQRSILNFIGPAVTVADDAVNSKTKVTVVAAGTGACAANTWVSTENDGAAPTCTQPAFSNLSGSATDAQIPDTITVNLAATASALTTDPAACAAGSAYTDLTSGGASTCTSFFDSTNPAGLAITSTGTVGTATVAARRDHAHPGPNIQDEGGATLGNFSNINCVGSSIACTYSSGTGVVTVNAEQLVNANTGDVTLNAADTYVTGSNLTIGARQKAGTILKWTFYMTKTAAGLATPIVNVRFGTLGTVAGDPVRNTATFLAQTAATDTGWLTITCIVRSVSATGVVSCGMVFEHAGTTTGFATAAQEQIKQVTSAGFDNQSTSTIAGVSINPGSAGVWTVQVVSAEASNLN